MCDRKFKTRKSFNNHRKVHHADVKNGDLDSIKRTYTFVEVLYCGQALEHFAGEREKEIEKQNHLRI